MQSTARVVFGLALLVCRFAAGVFWSKSRSETNNHPEDYPRGLADDLVIEGTPEILPGSEEAVAATATGVASVKSLLKPRRSEVSSTNPRRCMRPLHRWTRKISASCSSVRIRSCPVMTWSVPPRSSSVVTQNSISRPPRLTRVREEG